MSNYSKIISKSLSQKSPDLAALLERSSDNVGMLEELVKQLLAAQQQVAGRVTERIASVPGLPKPMVEMTEQMHGVAESMLRLQAEVWSGWFGMLRQLQGAEQKANPKGAEPAPAAEAVATPAAELATVPEPSVLGLANEQPDAAPTPEPEPEPKPEAAADSALAVDDLKAINGVGPAIERRLNEAGVFNYQQIAQWSDDDIDRIEAAVMSGRFVGRIRRDDWVGQAKSLLESDRSA